MCEKLSALSEKREVEYRKFRESLAANPEPSLSIEEGAETKKRKNYDKRRKSYHKRCSYWGFVY